MIVAKEKENPAPDDVSGYRFWSPALPAMSHFSVILSQAK